MKILLFISIAVSIVEYFYSPRLYFGKNIHLWYGTKLRKHIKLL